MQRSGFSGRVGRLAGLVSALGLWLGSSSPASALSLVLDHPSAISVGGQVTFTVALDEATTLNGYELFVSWDPAVLSFDLTQVVFNPGAGREVALGNRFPDSDIFVTPSPVFTVPGACTIVGGPCGPGDENTIPDAVFDPAGTRFSTISVVSGLTLELFRLRFNVLAFGNGSDPSFVVDATGGGLAPAITLTGTSASACVGPEGGVGACVGVPEPRLGLLLGLGAGLLLLRAPSRRSLR